VIASCESNPYAAPESDLVPEDDAPRLPYALIYHRFPAFVIDLMIIQIPGIIFIYAWQTTVPTYPAFLDVIGIIAWIGCYMIYATAYESSSTQATLGKQLFGLRVVDLAGNRLSVRTAFTRNLFKGLSHIGGFGYFMQPFTTRKQALHDILASALVIRDKSMFKRSQDNNTS